MRKLFAILLLAFIGIVVLLISFLHSPTPIVPKIVYIGLAQDVTNKIASFYITNSGSGSILLQGIRLEPQESSDGISWYPRPIRLAPDDKQARLQNTSWLKLGAGEDARILIDLPDENKYRVALDYSEQEKGFEGLTKRLEIFWKQRVWPGSVYGQPKQVRSNVIEKDS